MIRHVAIFTLKEGADLRRMTKAVDHIRDDVPGPMRSAYGSDLGLRPGNGGFAVTFDFPDEATYRAWDTNAEHERIRREDIAPFITGASRCQFLVTE